MEIITTTDELIELISPTVALTQGSNRKATSTTDSST